MGKGEDEEAQPQLGLPLGPKARLDRVWRSLGQWKVSLHIAGGGMR